MPACASEAHLFISRNLVQHVRGIGFPLGSGEGDSLASLKFMIFLLRACLCIRIPGETHIEPFALGYDGEFDQCRNFDLSFLDPIITGVPT